MKEELLVKYSNIPRKTCLDKLLRRRPASDNEDRMIVIGVPDPEIGNNQISTSKYNLISFPIFNLLEQFTKPSNIYFLVIGILQMIPAISVSEGKPTMFFPLTMVVLISMVKDFFEDWKRRKSDKRENESEIQILNQLGWSKMKWQDIQVGSIIRVKKNQYFPCDVLLLKHSQQSKLIYVQTKNLDGETNLKLKKIPQPLNFLQKQPQTQISPSHFEIFFEKPNQFINTFHGNLKINDKKYPLDNSNMILRGCSLKINEYAIGVCIYNGHETKIMQNNSHAVPKRSSMEKKLNSYFKFICLFQVLVTFVFSLVYGGIISTRYDTLEYISQSPYYMMDVVSDWGSWFISISNLIPISLLVTVELVRYGQGWVIMNPYKGATQKQIQVQSSSVNEQLGQIEYIMSDKTGTLTQNLMQFKCLLVNNKNFGYISQQQRQIREHRASILSNQQQQNEIEITPELAQQLQQKINSLKLNEKFKFIKQLQLKIGTKIDRMKFQKINELITNVNSDNGSSRYVDFAGDQKQRLLYQLKEELEKGNKEQQHVWDQEKMIHQTLMHLALCHNVIKQNKGYSSSSPDELALVSFAKYMGYQFIDKDDDNYIQVQLNSPLSQGTSVRYKLLHILEFTSQRKRMSVILQSQNDKKNIILLTKGADDTIISRSSSNISQKYFEQLNQSLYTYAYQGLRTLVLAYKKIDYEEYLKWDEKYCEALTYIGNNRMENIYELQAQLQKNLLIIGATAIEDKLQTNVKSTIEYLKKAGIKVWMLTGDKKETAVSIGLSCGLISQTCQKITLDCEPEHAQNLISNVTTLLQLQMLKGEKVVIVSGEILKKMKQQTKNKLANLLKECSSVICCRVSPKDKEYLTKLVMEWGRTLAVGDGANDVNMINAANIGVGVRGIEGSQATRAADFVIGQFQNLQKLVVFYGMNFYYRNSQVTLYNLYKNILVTFPILAYGPLSLLSSTYIYDTWIFQFYNIFYTALPILIFGLTDIKYSSYELNKNPSIYKIGQNNTFFNTKILILTFLTSALFGIVFVYVTYYCTEYSILAEGYLTFQIWSGMLVFNICVISVNIRIFMVSNQISLLLILSSIISVISYYLIFLFVGIILYSDVKNVLSKQLSSGVFWMVLITMVCAIQMTEWTLNKISNENSKYGFGQLINDQEKLSVERGILNQEELDEEHKSKLKKKISSRTSRSSDRGQDEIINQINGGYAFAEDEQRSMHFI